MILKVKCSKCGNNLHLIVKEENRRKAKRCKNYITGIIECKMIDEECSRW